MSYPENYHFRGQGGIKALTEALGKAPIKRQIQEAEAAWDEADEEG